MDLDPLRRRDSAGRDARASAFVVGELFNVWGQRPPECDWPQRGAVTAIVNGKAWTGSRGKTPLVSHSQAQRKVGRPRIAPISITWPEPF